MSKTGLRLRLLGLWALSLVACAGVGLLLGQLCLQSTSARVDRAETAIAHGCDLIRDRYRVFEGAWQGALSVSDPKLRFDLQTAVDVALTGQNGVEGGVWQAETGPLAYAFPTYPGTGPKTDLPAAERDHIQAVNDQAARDERPVGRRSVARGQNLLLYACPLAGPIPRLTGWTMIRVESVPEYDRLRLGLAVLLGVMALMTVWLGRVLLLWAHDVSGVEAAREAAGAGGAPALAGARKRERGQSSRRRRKPASVRQRSPASPPPWPRASPASTGWPSESSAPSWRWR
jgi:hypothetical protein